MLAEVISTYLIWKEKKIVHKGTGVGALDALHEKINFAFYELEKRESKREMEKIHDSKMSNKGNIKWMIILCFELPFTVNLSWTSLTDVSCVDNNNNFNMFSV